MSGLLVTGSSGFIDRPKVAGLRKLGHEVFTLDIHGGVEENFSVDVNDVDLANIYEEIKPQAVIQLATR